jgi:DNA-binding transcriptional LysR family regulator
MELRHLTYFVAVAERLNFSRAAEMLRVAQPAISQQIKALEQALGAQLFDRFGRRVRLTAAGQALLPHARRILAAAETAEQEVRELGQLARGTARLGAPSTVSAHLLPAQLTAFKRHYPGLEVALREAGTESLITLIEAGELDLAIVVTDVLPPHLAVVPFREETYVLVVSARHALAAHKQVPLADLAAEAFILFPEGYKLREVTLTACRRAGFEPKIALDGGATQSALEFVAAGLGVAIVPQLALGHVNGLHILQITDQPLRRSLGVVWHEQHYLSPAARALRDFLVKPPPPEASKNPAG